MTGFSQAVLNVLDIVVLSDVPPSEVTDPNKVLWPFSRSGNFLGGIFEVALNTQTETAKANQTETITPVQFSGKAPKRFCRVSVNAKVRS